MKRLDKPNWRRKREQKKSLWLILFGVLTIVPLVIGAAFVYRNAASESSELEFGGSQIVVRAGGNFQAALDRAKSGDTIVLQAGAKFTGAFVLPNKTGGEFITIQSSDIAKLPKDGERVKLKDATSMPKILSSGKGKPAIETAPGAHHYRFVGIEIAPANNDYIYNLVYLSAEKPSDVPHHIEVERCYLHSNQPNGVTRRGIALNSADTIIRDSYLEGFAGAGEETQGIGGWSGTKNVKIINNYIEGGAENILFGGSDPASADLIPSDIEVRGNHLNKPAEWNGKYTVKCLFELKNAKRVNFVGNYLENNWEGSAFRITVRNQDGGAPFSTIEDAAIKDNIVINAGAGINILGTDDTHPSGTLKRLVIANNLWLDIKGYFFQIAGGEDVSIINNTSFNDGNIASIYGDATKNLLFRDNIVTHSEYGIHGFAKTLKSIEAQKIFQNNLVINNKNIPPNEKSVPPNNFWVDDANAVGFQNFAQQDFRLAPKSRYKGKGKDGGDLGSNLTLNNPAK